MISGIMTCEVQDQTYQNCRKIIWVVCLVSNQNLFFCGHHVSSRVFSENPNHKYVTGFLCSQMILCEYHFGLHCIFEPTYSNCNCLHSITLGSLAVSILHRMDPKIQYTHNTSAFIVCWKLGIFKPQIGRIKIYGVLWQPTDCVHLRTTRMCY